MKDTNRAYRNAVLDATRPYADAALYEVLIPVLTKSKDAAAQTDLGSLISDAEKPLRRFLRYWIVSMMRMPS